MRVLIAGYGYVGQALGRRLVAQGDSVVAVRRRLGAEVLGVKQLALDLTSPDASRSLPSDIDAVVYAVAPDERSDAAYHAAYVLGLSQVLKAAAAANVQRIIFTSSTAVYREHEGGWVDESSPLSHDTFSARRLVEAEELARSASGVVLRLAGIYGPGRIAFLRSVQRGEVAAESGPPRYMNRIHRDDCAGAILHLLQLARPEPIYLGVDDAPAEKNAVVAWLRNELGLPPSESRTAPSPSARNVGNKRCSNARLRRSGYAFRYPSFREGYAPLIQAELGLAPQQ